MSDDQEFFGQQGVTDAASEVNAHKFHIRQHIGHVRSGTPVKVIAVHGGGVGPAPTIDVQLQVNQIDAQGNSTPHGIVYGIPTTRIQGGIGAVINDPVVGDIGVMHISDRDISALKANAGAQSNPGSFRRHDFADGVYDKAFLNPATPTNYIRFVPGGGFHIQDQFGNSITTGAGGIVLTDCNGNIMNMMTGAIKNTTANLESTGGIQAGVGGPDSVTLQHHTHGGGPPPDPGT